MVSHPTKPKILPRTTERPSLPISKATRETSKSFVKTHQPPCKELQKNFPNSRKH